MDSNAKAYSSLNKPQYDVGCDFIRELNLSSGIKVLDMGCGTGELTKFIVDQVGPDGEVVGVDPDEARVKIGQEKLRDVKNINLVVGNSATGFPHDSEEYYDVHFSSYVFHWLKNDDKKHYLRKAYQCLKPGGRMAILTGVKEDVPSSTMLKSFEHLTEAEYEELVRSVGVFSDIKTNKGCHLAEFTSHEEFRAWIKATCYHDLEELATGMEPDWLKNVLERYTKTGADGRITVRFSFVRIIGTK